MRMYLQQADVFIRTSMSLSGALLVRLAFLSQQHRKVQLSAFSPECQRHSRPKLNVQVICVDKTAGRCRMVLLPYKPLRSLKSCTFRGDIPYRYCCDTIHLNTINRLTYGVFCFCFVLVSRCQSSLPGAVYVDAGGCTDLQPVHSILARVIPSYDHGSRAQNRNPLLSHHPSARPAEPQTVRAGEPRKLMNLAHR